MIFNAEILVANVFVWQALQAIWSEREAVDSIGKSLLIWLNLSYEIPR